MTMIYVRNDFAAQIGLYLPILSTAQLRTDISLFIERRRQIHHYPMIKKSYTSQLVMVFLMQNMFSVLIRIIL